MKGYALRGAVVHGQVPAALAVSPGRMLQEALAVLAGLKAAGTQAVAGRAFLLLGKQCGRAGPSRLAPRGPFPALPLSPPPPTAVRATNHPGTDLPPQLLRRSFMEGPVAGPGQHTEDPQPGLDWGQPGLPATMPDSCSFQMDSGVSEPGEQA